MKRIITISLSALLVVLLCVGAFAATAVTQPTITITTNAKIEVDPNVAYVSLGVTSSNAKATKAKDDNAKKMQSVLDALKKIGVEKDDIETSYISMYPTYDYSKGDSKINGYQVSNTIKITIKNLDKVSEIVNAAMNSGANTLNDVRFDLDDSDEYYSKALTIATKKALPKANVIATAAGMKVDKLVSLVEDGASYTAMYANLNYEVADEGMNSTAQKTDIGDSIQAGKITVSARITIVYSLK